MSQSERRAIRDIKYVLSQVFTSFIKKIWGFFLVLQIYFQRAKYLDNLNTSLNRISLSVSAVMPKCILLPITRLYLWSLLSVRKRDLVTEQTWGGVNNILLPNGPGVPPVLGSPCLPPGKDISQCQRLVKKERNYLFKKL